MTLVMMSLCRRLLGESLGDGLPGHIVDALPRLLADFLSTSREPVDPFCDGIPATEREYPDPEVVVLKTVFTWVEFPSVTSEVNSRVRHNPRQTMLFAILWTGLHREVVEVLEKLGSIDEFQIDWWSHALESSIDRQTHLVTRDMHHIYLVGSAGLNELLLGDRVLHKRARQSSRSSGLRHDQGRGG